MRLSTNDPRSYCSIFCPSKKACRIPHVYIFEKSIHPPLHLIYLLENPSVYLIAQPAHESRAQVHISNWVLPMLTEEGETGGAVDLKCLKLPSVQMSVRQLSRNINHNRPGVRRHSFERHDRRRRDIFQNRLSPRFSHRKSATGAMGPP